MLFLSSASQSAKWQKNQLSENLERIGKVFLAIFCNILQDFPGDFALFPGVSWNLQK